ncbi:hypothetical protein GCM10027188_02030 [Lysobacter humi (ex Lee et al. 2017)]
MDAKAHVATTRLDRRDRADALDDAGEHQRSPRGAVRAVLQLDMKRFSRKDGRKTPRGTKATHARPEPCTR